MQADGAHAPDENTAEEQAEEDAQNAQAANDANIEEQQAQESASSQTSEDAASAAQRPRTVTLHHTAYWCTTAYRIVHHQASTAYEVTVGGVTSIQWSTCPVCGQKHESAYNERIEEVLEEGFCAVCGEKHAQDYDEVVSY